MADIALFGIGCVCKFLIINAGGEEKYARTKSVLGFDFRKGNSAGGHIG